ncbi:MAG TPA: lipase maturation factor family protein [Bryobacteraceae bacterium]|nr:lipase maturation factor family protein [Bryobacteraceae bacterium]
MSGGQIPWAWKQKIGWTKAEMGLTGGVRTFQQVLGFVYLIAFTSFGRQAPGLIGSHGILPFAAYLAALKTAMGGQAYREIPTVLWLRPTDAALAAVWMAGAAAALAAIFAPARGWWRRAALAVCLVLWISLCAVGQDFLSFQWDVLLSETGLLAIFADTSAVRIWLFRWLIFRLMFSSGLVKLTSGDPSWKSLTAMHYHFETQPLPNPLAWLIYQQPMWVAKAETAFTLIAELVVPFLFFAPRRARHVGGWIAIALQLLILSSGNYTYFNFLTIALCLWLFLEPEKRQWGRPHKAVSASLAAFVGVASGLILLEQFSLPLPPGGSAVVHLLEPLRVVNSYGLFAVMTTERPEIIVEGSADGVNWRAYEFPYKPGDVMRAPPVIEPDQPRLDWQMWFAALDTYQSNRWFVDFMVRLLEGEPAVLRLLRYNPFPDKPPKYVRARLFLYRFTNWHERGWWTREERGLYFPAAGLK